MQSWNINFANFVRFGVGTPNSHYKKNNSLELNQKDSVSGASSVVQSLRLCTPHAGVMGLMLGRERSHMLCGKAKKKECIF